MSLTTRELRTQVGGELNEARKAICRAVNLLKHNDSKDVVIKHAEQLEKTTVSTSYYIDDLLAK